MPRTRPVRIDRQGGVPVAAARAHQDRGGDVERTRQGQRVQVQPLHAHLGHPDQRDPPASPGRAGPRRRSRGPAACPATPRRRASCRPSSSDPTPAQTRTRLPSGTAKAGAWLASTRRSSSATAGPSASSMPTSSSEGRSGRTTAGRRRGGDREAEHRGRGGIQRPAELLVVGDLAPDARAAAVQRPVEQHRRGALASELCRRAHRAAPVATARRSGPDGGPRGRWPASRRPPPPAPRRGRARSAGRARAAASRAARARARRWARR